MKIEKELTKRYYTISEVADMFGVAKSLIRYWETEFSKIRPKKDKNGVRRFTVKDIRIIELVYTLVKERGFTLDGARKELMNMSTNDSSKIKNQLKQKLLRILNKLEDMESNV